MDDLIRDIFPVRRSIDDAVDEAESLSITEVELSIDKNFGKNDSS